MYAIIAYKWGLRDSHSYCVAIKNTLELANEISNEHHKDRGGKYGIETVNEKGEAVAYIESDYFGNGIGEHPVLLSKLKELNTIRGIK